MGAAKGHVDINLPKSAKSMITFSSGDWSVARGQKIRIIREIRGKI